MPYFPYGTEEVAYLSRRDPALGAVMAQLGQLQREVEPSLFASLVSAIAGQQISTAAVRTVWARIRAGLGQVSPQAVRGCTPQELQRFGMSLRKAGYIRRAAEKVLDGSLDLEALRRLPDAQAAAALQALDGVGPWTAQMVLLFGLQRPDVLSTGDLGIQRGLRMLHGHDRLSPVLCAHYRALYAPCGSVASLYLWAISGGAVPGLRDPAEGGPTPTA